MTVAAINKTIKKHEKAACEHVPPVSRLTEPELDSLRLAFRARNAAIRLGNAKAIREEMKKVYRAVVKGDIPLGAGTKLVFILDRIAKSENDEKKLDILAAGGLSGEPFVGLQILPPPAPDRQTEGPLVTNKRAGQPQPSATAIVDGVVTGRGDTRVTKG